MSATKTIKATLIWKIKHSEYKGNAHFFGELCEHLDAANFTINGIAAKDNSAFKKIYAEVEFSYSENQHMDEDSALDLLMKETQGINLPWTYLILINTIESEFNNLQMA